MVGRLEGEALAVAGEQRLDLGERRAGARREHQFGRLVERDAGQPRGREGRGGLHRAAEAGARPAALDGERRPLRRGLGDDRGELGLRRRAGEPICRHFGASSGRHVRSQGYDRGASFERGSPADAVSGAKCRAEEIGPDDDARARPARRRAAGSRSVNSQPAIQRRPIGAVLLDAHLFHGRSVRSRPGRTAIDLPQDAAARAAPAGRRAGKTLAGLSSQAGSKTLFTRICWSRSAAVNWSGIRSRFSMPTPCSPVRQPPTSTQSFEDVGAGLLGLRELVGIVGVEEDQRMEVAVAGVEDVGDARGRSRRRCR